MNKSALTIAVLACVATANAANPKTEKIDTLKAYELQNVQVVATRADKKTPMAYSDLNKRQISAVNHGKDVPQLLEMTPSVTVSSDAGMGIGYTGIHVRGTDPTRINITTDGIPMNDAESSAVFWVNMGDFVSSVESIQIQRGAGTSTNGAGAFGATINMQTESIGIKPFGSIDLSGGSYGTHKETFRFGTGLLGDHWGFQGRLSNIGSDGYIDRASTRLNSYFMQGGYFNDNTVVKFITFNGTEKTYHAWDYASKADMKKYGRRYNPSGKYKDAAGNTVFYDNQTDNYHQQHYYLIWNQRLSNAWKLNASLHYTHGFGYYEQYKADSEDSHVKLYKYLLSSTLGKYSDLIRRKQMRNNFYGAVASVSYDARKGLSAILGGGWNKYDGDHFGNVIWVRSFNGSIDPNHKYYDNNARKTDANIYGKVNYEFLPGLNAYADMQYRRITYRLQGSSQEFDNNKKQLPLDLDRTYNFFNPKFGLVYTAGPNHTLYVSYAIAHKEPTRNDFENMLAETKPVAPKAERLNDLEVGYKYQSSIFSAGANFYYMDYDNQFVPTGAQDANGEMVSRNIKDSYRMGVELTAGLNPFRGFSWNINATWSKNRAKNVDITTIDPVTWAESTANVGTTHLAYSPDFILGNMFSYEYKGFTASLQSKFVGEQYMTNSNFRSYAEKDGSQTSAMIDSYFVSNFDLSYTFKLRGIKSATVGLTVYNLFNEEYESNGSCSMNFKQDGNKIVAYNAGWAWTTYSAQAPTHLMAHLSINF